MSPQMLTRGRRMLAGTTATALTAGVLALAPATAQAADDVAAPTLQWKVSDQFAAHFTPNPAFSPFTTLVPADGATLDAATQVTTFRNGVGRVDSTDGSTTVAYEGSITGSFITGTVAPGTLQYTLTISDPAVTIAPSGSSAISADVSWTVPGETPSSASAQNVTVASFDAAAASVTAESTRVSLTALPSFLGVIVPDSSTATELGIPAGKPINGGAFHPEFLRALPTSLRAHFYLSGSSGGDPRKPVSPFTASFDKVKAAPVVAGVSTRYAGGAVVTVVAPVPGTVTVAGLGKRSATVAGQRVGFTVPKATTAGTKRYSVSFAPTDASLLAPAATTVTVKIAKAAAARAQVKVTKKPTRKAKGKATVTVKGVTGGAAPTGKVRLKLSKGKTSRYVNVTLVKGKRTVALPKLAKGTWTIRAAYYGNANYTKRGYVKVGSVKVTK